MRSLLRAMDDVRQAKRWHALVIGFGGLVLVLIASFADSATPAEAVLYAIAVALVIASGVCLALVAWLVASARHEARRVTCHPGCWCRGNEGR